MHSKRRYKISICSVILGKLNTFFQNCNGFSIIFAKNFRCYLARYENENLFDSSVRHILNPSILGFLFSTKNSLAWGPFLESPDN